MGDDGSLVQAGNLDMFARLNPYAHRSGLAFQPGAAHDPAVKGSTAFLRVSSGTLIA